MRKPLRVAAFALGAGLILAGQVRAESLSDALALAYDSNPTLLSQRAQLRALDETSVQARAALRPTLGATVQVGHAEAPQQVFGSVQPTTSDSARLGLSASQPLYTGGKATGEIRAAEARISGGREQLRATEAQVFLSVIQAYCDVLRDRAVLAIQRDSIKALQDAFDEIKARFEAGANTSTDVSQASAQLEAARALVANAQAQLEVSVAEYVAAVGQSPGELRPLEALSGLPRTIGEALDAAQDQSPALRQARYAEAESRQNVVVARAGRRPTVGVTGAFGALAPVTPFVRRNFDRDVSVSLTITQPLFAGGTVSSQIRQAQEQDNAQHIQIEVTRRAVVQNVTQAWSRSHGAQAGVIAEDAAVRSAQKAYDGMREEYRAGLRGTLDVLVAEQTLRDAQVALMQARHDAFLADALVSSAAGRLEAAVLLPGAQRYDPAKAARKVQGAGWLPWDVVPASLDQLATDAQKVGR